MHLFSILIANYNNSRYLSESIGSVLRQTYSNWEIILVDDGSTDSFEDVVSAFKNESRIKIYRNSRNEGCGFTKRKCTSLASGYLAAFLDPDDMLDPDTLAEMMESHLEYPQCSIIHSTHYVCNEEMDVTRIAEYPGPLPLGMPYLLLSDGRIHAFASFKMSCYNRTRGLSPLNKKAVDQDLYYLLEETGPVLFINKPLYYYRIHRGAISNYGEEGAATIWHYEIIREACQRRIKQMDADNADAHYWIKKYRTRYYKIGVFYYFRKKMWMNCLSSFIMFAFRGGMTNLVHYAKKIPREGWGLFRKSLIDNYEIKT